MAFSSSFGTSRVVALVDMDCFYVQVEERDDPSIKGKPAAVVQYKAYKGGGIIAVNYEARAKGVSRNMRGDDATAACPEIILVRVPELRGKADLTKYRNAGRDVIQVLSEFSSCVERASIDEAYIDLTSLVDEKIAELQSDQDYFSSNKSIIKSLAKSSFSTNFVLGHQSTEDWFQMIQDSEIPTEDLKLAIAAEIVGRMREAVFQKTGFRCSAGIAHNKVLAKLGAGLNKPNKQTVLPHGSIPKLWETTKIKKVRNLGGQLGDFLVQKFNCEMMSDLMQFSENDLNKGVGSKAGSWIYKLVQGFDDEAVNPRQLPKSVGCSKNFLGPEALTTKEKVKHWTEQLVAEVAERLGKDCEENKRRAKTLTLHVSFEDHNSVSRTCRAHPQYNVERMKAEVWSLMDKLYQTLGIVPVNMLGLVASRFEDNVAQCPKISSFFDSKTLTEKTDTSTSKSIPTSIITNEKPFVETPATNQINPFNKLEMDNSMLETSTEQILGLSPAKNPTTQECQRCGFSVNIWEYISHMDHHTARDLSREINGLPPLGFDLRPATLEAREREQSKLEREKQLKEKTSKRPRGRGAGGNSKRGRTGPSKSPTKPLSVKPIDSYFVKKS